MLRRGSGWVHARLLGGHVARGGTWSPLVRWRDVPGAWRSSSWPGAGHTASPADQFERPGLAMAAVGRRDASKGGTWQQPAAPAPYSQPHWQAGRQARARACTGTSTSPAPHRASRHVSLTAADAGAGAVAAWAELGCLDVWAQDRLRALEASLRYAAKQCQSWEDSAKLGSLVDRRSALVGPPACRRRHPGLAWPPLLCWALSCLGSLAPLPPCTSLAPPPAPPCAGLAPQLRTQDLGYGCDLASSEMPDLLI